MCEFQDKVAAARAAVPSISANEAYKLEGVVFIDPRPADAVAKTTGKIPGAMLLSLDDIEAGNLPDSLRHQQTEVVTSCQGGPMGAIAAHELAKRGFTSVRYIEGGTQAWLDAGFPTHR